jgi:hypothetical protein
MKRQAVSQFLKPEWRRLLLFALFLAIAVGGKIQAWAFSDLPPKPPLYDLLRPLPIWPIWMFLLLPLALVTYPLRLVGIDVMAGSPWLFITANLIYFYLLSCLVMAGLDWARARRRSQRGQ